MVSDDVVEDVYVCVFNKSCYFDITDTSILFICIDKNKKYYFLHAVLMRDPILQEKRQEHVMFQKYALELLERVSGKSKHMGAEFETSLANIHRVSDFRYCSYRCRSSFYAGNIV